MKDVLRQVKIFLIGLLATAAVLLVASRTATPLSPSAFQVKRLQEKIFMRLKSSPQSRLEYYTFLLGERLTDLKAVAKDDDTSYILRTSLRYSTTAGQIADFIKENGLTDQTPSVLVLFRNHQDAISKLIESYPNDFNEDWKFLQDDINYLTIYSSMLSQLK